MAADHRLAPHATLPDRYARLEVLASTIDHHGRLVALVADPTQGFTPIPHFSALQPPPRYDATAVICDGPETHEIPLTDLNQWVTLIDTLGDGVVLANPRCEPVDIDIERYQQPIPADELHLTQNVQVISADGHIRSAFYAGDGIEQLMTDVRGAIWISYCDQSNYWFSDPDGTRSYGFALGLARWNSNGGKPWMASSHTPDVFWGDCYALNVGRDVVHACPYTDFPLVEIDDHGVRSITPNPITRCSGLTVSGLEVAFLDQHRTEAGSAGRSAGAADRAAPSPSRAA
ncbi:hypothetical protein FXF51_51010 [Nonomuraea sp. PA05]|uniref:hypothetical protein n=1 Tax=Nonomuraea sp. PA05 TaxID=2604466 RepID=UPI0011D7316A|nr:hypothetical protein [Nonomuraea sp. PA05]TYB52800.1 hypothetical protein FXF51_51010 [Nonomuraea sp. PA05]